MSTKQTSRSAQKIAHPASGQARRDPFLTTSSPRGLAINRSFVQWQERCHGAIYKQEPIIQERTCILSLREETREGGEVRPHPGEMLQAPVFRRPLSRRETEFFHPLPRSPGLLPWSRGAPAPRRGSQQ